MTPNTVRSAVPEDLATVCALLEEMHGKPPWPPGDDHHAGILWSRILSDPNRRVLVADDGPQVVGTVDVVIVPNLSRDLAAWAGVENLVVTASHRGRGVGRALLEAAIEQASKAGCYKVQLISASSRVAAHNLYETSGFNAEVRGYRRYLHDIGDAPASAAIAPRRNS